MPVDLSIKQVPDDIAERLRLRAAGNRRSLQRELLTIIEQAVGGYLVVNRVSDPRPEPYLVPKAGKRRSALAGAKQGKLSLDQLWQRARKLGAPVGGESSASLIRKDRDARHGS